MEKLLTQTGVLIECEPAIKSIIVHLDSVNNDIIIEDLDETHLVVKENMVQVLKQKLEDVRSLPISLPTLCRICLADSDLLDSVSRRPIGLRNHWRTVTDLWSIDGLCHTTWVVALSLIDLGRKKSIDGVRDHRGFSPWAGYQSFTLQHKWDTIEYPLHITADFFLRASQTWASASEAPTSGPPKRPRSGGPRRSTLPYTSSLRWSVNISNQPGGKAR